MIPSSRTETGYAVIAKDSKDKAGDEAFHSTTFEKDENGDSLKVKNSKYLDQFCRSSISYTMRQKIEKQALKQTDTKFDEKLTKALADAIASFENKVSNKDDQNAKTLMTNVVNLMTKDLITAKIMSGFEPSDMIMPDIEKSGFGLGQSKFD